MTSLLPLLPTALIALVCPLAMFFMMRGMHGGHGQPQHAPATAHGPENDALNRLQPEGSALPEQIAGRR